MRKQSIALMIFLMTFLIILSVGIAGCSSPPGNSSPASSPVSSPADKIITKDLSSIALTIYDFPTGWELYSAGTSNSTIYKNVFTKIGAALDAYVVSQTINKYNTVDDAKTQYNSQKGQITTVRVESVNIGDEGFGYIRRNSEVVVFRTGNIITQVEYDVGGIGAASTQLNSLNDATQYARIIANRIR